MRAIVARTGRSASSTGRPRARARAGAPSPTGRYGAIAGKTPTARR